MNENDDIEVIKLDKSSDNKDIEVAAKELEDMDIEKLLEESYRLVANKDSDNKNEVKEEKNDDKNLLNDKNDTNKIVNNDAPGSKGGSKKSSKSRKKKLYKTLYIIAMTILISIFVGCSIYLIVYFWQAKKIDKKVDELKEMIVEEDDTEFEVVEEETIVKDDGEKIEFVYVNGTKVQKKYAKIFRENNDFIGWLTIAGTEIDYPVMQTMDDEEYYLHRDFDKNYNGNGTLFVDTSADVSRPSDNMIIYGHNMKNGKMFHDILKYEDEDFYKEHKYIQFDTIYGDGKYEVIAAFRTEIYDENYAGFKYYTFFDAGLSEEFDSYVSECRQRTPYNIFESAVYGDKLITLSTCAYHADEGRFVVVAKKIE
ncbi:MAG: class B sortase [Lachnospiraceae bacterium]|nr:class B sortase [Lachnospiraceae bacterium]